MLRIEPVFSVALLLFVFVGIESVHGQSSRFPKSTRGVAQSVANPSRIQTPAQNQAAARAQQFSGRARPKSQQFNNRSYYSPRGVQGTGHRYSPSHFQGYYVPLNSRFSNSFGLGFGAPIYNPNIVGYRYGNSGFRNYNPAYSTYGSYLNTGGVLGSNAIGSSVAAQALRQLNNQQQFADPSVNNAQHAEILRLQIELERAKLELAQQNQAKPGRVQQQTLKPAVAAPKKVVNNSKAIEQLDLAAIVETNKLATSSHLNTERAFRCGEYGQAARFSGLARSLDESNGKLMLFSSQAHFANGEYREAVDALTKASTLLKPDELGYVVQNFKLFYGQNDFVPQMKQLSAHLKKSPKDANASLLRGFQYGALGFPIAAKKDLERARTLGANPDLVDKMLATFASEVVDQIEMRGY